MFMTEETFVRVVNSLSTDKEGILEELRSVQDQLTGTKALEDRLRGLAVQMNTDADVVQELIAENARVANDQEAYWVRYEAMA